MVKWLGQRDEFRCGPIALANVMKWAGMKRFKRRSINEKLVRGHLAELCDTDEEGTPTRAFEAVLYNLPGIIVTRIVKPTRWDIKHCLRNDGIVVLEAPWWNASTRELIWHYCLLINVSPNSRIYTVVNAIEGQALTWIYGKELANTLRHKGVTIYTIYREKQ